MSLTLRAGDDPRGEDVSASQYSAATLSTDHHLRAELLHRSEDTRERSHEPLNLSLDILLVLEMWRFLATMYHD